MITSFVSLHVCCMSILVYLLRYSIFVIATPSHILYLSTIMHLFHHHSYIFITLESPVSSFLVHSYLFVISQSAESAFPQHSYIIIRSEFFVSSFLVHSYIFIKSESAESIFS